MRLPTLYTRRLEIRQLEVADWRSVYAYAADPAVMTYIPEGTFTEAQAQAFVAVNSGDEAQAYAVVHHADQQLIGHMVFHLWYAPQTYEIGWVFNPAYHRQGYATEAAAALLAYGFEELKLHRIIATCQPENPASYGVMEKIGMRREGWFRKCIYRDQGRWWDELFYAILGEEGQHKDLNTLWKGEGLGTGYPLGVGTRPAALP
jgi:RimJ/RimL family protein N-acetyltransferase